MKTKTNSSKFQLYLTNAQIVYLEEYSSKKGITKSELIRRILDEWIEKKLSS